MKPLLKVGRWASCGTATRVMNGLPVGDRAVAARRDHDAVGIGTERLRQLLELEAGQRRVARRVGGRFETGRLRRESLLLHLGVKVVGLDRVAERFGGGERRGVDLAGFGETVLGLEDLRRLLG